MTITKALGRIGTIILAVAATVAVDATADAITDSRDGKTYKAVKIGGYTWMAENLNYKTGTSWCYGDDESNCAKYGRLYDWKTANKACPKGWRLPSREEWVSLASAAGGKSVAGEGLKSKGGWSDGGNGKDVFGFSALPGGHRISDNGGSFNDAGYGGDWWSATDGGSTTAHYWLMDGSGDYVGEHYGHKYNGFAVRCSKD